jgi:hypothetical protein
MVPSYENLALIANFTSIIFAGNTSQISVGNVGGKHPQYPEALVLQNGGHQERVQLIQHSKIREEPHPDSCTKPGTDPQF